MFGQRLREMRIKNNYTQQNMADLLNVALRSYQKYEQGERSPSYALLVQIGDLLDVSLDYLLGRDDFIASRGNKA